MHSDTTIRAPISVKTEPVDFSITPSPPLSHSSSVRARKYVHYKPVSPKSVNVVPDKTKVRTACRRTNDRTTNSVTRHIAAPHSMRVDRKVKDVETIFGEKKQKLLYQKQHTY